MKKWYPGMLLAVFAAALLMVAGGTAADKPTTSIKQVMKKCMKGGLCKKVASGKASDEEKATLVKMFTALAAAKPKKGDAESWKKLTGALVAAAKDSAAGKESGPKALGKAANCKACHSVHK